MATIAAAEPFISNAPEKAQAIYVEIIKKTVDASIEEDVKEKETAVLKLAALFSKQGNNAGIGELIKQTRPFLQCISKAKAAKLVRNLLDLYIETHTVSHDNAAVNLCKELSLIHI